MQKIHVENSTYYHIQRNGKWKKGEIHFIGKNKNPFVSYFDTTIHCIKDPGTEKSYNINFVAEEMLNYNRTGIKNSALDGFYHFDTQKTLAEVLAALKEYLLFTREVIFEEVRKDFFPDRPSRYRGIWVIPHDLKCLQYWWDTLGKSGTILELQITGKLHRANQQYLTLNTNRLDFIRQEAFKYWASTTGINEVEEECLFEGFAEVVDIINPNNIGII